jgi:hypothetical protein
MVKLIKDNKTKSALKKCRFCNKTKSAFKNVDFVF